MTDPTFWILARASGLTAYVLLTAALLAGLALKSRPFGGLLRAATVLDLHRFLTLLALGATALHGAALLLDSAVPITIVDLLVPGLAPYRPVWTAAGVLAAILALLVTLSFPARRWIGVRAWRALHWTAYAVFGLATAHGVFAGTDTGRPWAAGLYAGALGIVALAGAWRLLATPARATGRGRVRSR